MKEVLKELRNSSVDSRVERQLIQILTEKEISDHLGGKSEEYKKGYRDGWGRYEQLLEEVLATMLRKRPA